MNKQKILSQIDAILDLNELLNFMLVEIQNLSPTEIVLIQLKEAEQIKIYLAHFPKGHELSEMRGVLENTFYVIKENQLMANLFTTQQTQYFYQKEETAKDPSDLLQKRFKLWKSKQMVHIPILLERDQIIGVISFYYIQGNMTKDQVSRVKNLLRVFAYSLSKLHRLKQLEQLQENSATAMSRYHKFSQLISELNQLLDTSSVYELFIKKILEIFHFDFGFILLAEGNYLTILDGAAVSKDIMDIYQRVKNYFNVKGHQAVIRGGAPNMACALSFVRNLHYYFNNVQEILHLPMMEMDKTAIKVMASPIQTVLHMPIRDQNRPIGVLELYTLSKPANLQDNDLELISQLCSFIPSVLRNSSIHQELEQKKQVIENKNKQFQEELMLAQQIQKKLIPTAAPPQKNLEVVSIYKPMLEVGGDFFDYVTFKEPNLLGFFISDVSGHGVAAALITSMIKMLIETAGKERISPGKLLQYINNKLLNQMGGNFITAFYGILDMNSLCFRFARGGHEFPLLIRDKKVIPLKSKGKVLGIMEDLIVEEQTILLHPGDKIFYYTDGLTDALNLEGEMFGEFFISYLEKRAHYPIQKMVESIESLFLKHTRQKSMEDDVCVIGVEILKKEI